MRDWLTAQTLSGKEMYTNFQLRDMTVYKIPSTYKVLHRGCLPRPCSAFMSLHSLLCNAINYSHGLDCWTVQARAGLEQWNWIHAEQKGEKGPARQK